MTVKFDIAIASQTSSPQLVVIALMHRLHTICVQLFLTILQIIGSQCDDKEATSPAFTDESRSTRRLAEIEARMLRRVTSSIVEHSPTESRRHRRGQPASCPPSPQLFAIDEEEC